MGSTDDATTSNADVSAPSAGSGWFPCPYCGEKQNAGTSQCSSCSGLFEPLSRQATQNHMGPWQVRDASAPFTPGCSYATIRRMAQRGKIAPDAVLRGPTTRQFWMVASEIPGVAHLLGRCHACKGEASADAFSCDHCGAAFPTPEDRQSLGLAPVRLLPGQAPPALVARSASPAESPPIAPAGAAPPTAFAALVRNAAASRTSPRPSEPSELAPASLGSAPPRVEPSPASSAPDYSRALRASNRRVSALKMAVIALAVVNAVLIIVAVAALLSGGAPDGAGAGAQENAQTSE